MPDLVFELVDEETFDDIPAPAKPRARCQTCDYWERIDGGREAPEPEATDAVARASLKRSRLFAGRAASGSYGMLAYRIDAVERVCARTNDPRSLPAASRVPRAVGDHLSPGHRGPAGT